MPLMIDTQRIRYKTTLNETLLPDDVIANLITANSTEGTLDLYGAVADAFEYMAAATGTGQDVKSYTRGQTSEVFSRTLRETAVYYRGLSTNNGIGVISKTIQRVDYAVESETEYGPVS